MSPALAMGGIGPSTSHNARRQSQVVANWLKVELSAPPGRRRTGGRAGCRAGVPAVRAGRGCGGSGAMPGRPVRLSRGGPASPGVCPLPPARCAGESRPRPRPD
ncbi:hypothetical protein CP966_17485 [Streptomyces galilaeus]|nr:hypothetical protein CP966_17485 [Streptomyces galilaeus]